ncbi:50S ribosomal protein L11 methyltransferase [Alicyclobacillus sp.]|uniref:50S ribosomal protein L11 methyltransferase n=1 Tax=Alicyclobacillus sp. TaxID=61169 RepID=UPI0025C6F0CA|nr:50S ribosomal protein L11 methyltransferase [Alicyclobacillus sp.]MCL6516345.1 50S ribosomal protein L11 methyltransferase [Alicyclobacillus sp.]
MEWWQIRLAVPAEASEAVAARLQEWPEIQGVALEGLWGEEPPHPEYGEWFDDSLLHSDRMQVSVYLPATVAEDEWRRRLARDLAAVAAAGLDVDGALEGVEAERVDEAQWASAWKEEFTPIPVGRRLLIVPRWMRDEADPEDRLPIVIEPGMAFGTGTHATTQLCLEALEDLPVAGARVLDIGCGTGVLSIGAARLGASSVTAIDLDPVAVHAAAENVADNGLSRVISVRQGDLLRDVPAHAGYDGALANILRDAVIALAPQAAKVLVPGGWLVTSGFVEGQADQVGEGLKAAGFDPVRRLQREDWVALVAVRRS